MDEESHDAGMPQEHSHNQKKPHEQPTPTMHDGHEGMELPPCIKLHVVVHGLICIRLSLRNRTVELHVPSVGMHEYHFGTYGNWQTLQYGHDYRLGGVQVGKLRLDSPSIKDQHLAFCLSENPDLSFGARGTHAAIQLPWPDDVRGVRQINNAPDHLFPGSNVTVNPRHMHYITYLTYRVLVGDRPVLEKCCRPVWSSEGLGIDGHVRLHFFGDPFKSLNKNTWKMHIPDAYGCLGDQLFHGGLFLTPNISNRWQFDPSEHKADIPDPEAQDYIPPKLGGGGEGGNCLPPLVLD